MTAHTPIRPAAVRVSIRNNRTGQIITGSAASVSTRRSIWGWTDWDIIEVTEPTPAQDAPQRRKITHASIGASGGDKARQRALERRRTVIRMLEEGATVDAIQQAVGVGPEVIRIIRRAMGERRTGA